MNFSILKLSPSTYGSQLHWFSQRCTIYKFKTEFWILLRIPIKMFINDHQCSSPNNQNTITKEKKHCNINETTPSYHPLIIKTSQHHQHTSPRFHRNMPETSPTHQNTWSIIRRHTSHSYTGLPKGAQFTNSNWNLRFCLETRSKCSSVFIRKSKHHHQRNKNSTATSTTQQLAITHSSS